MSTAATSPVKRFLRSPKVIVAELAALGLACALGAAIPQAGSATAEELARLPDSLPFGLALVKFLALDHIFRSAWFLAIAGVAAASLALVVREQFRRVRALWRQPLTPAHFDSAPFRVEFDRPTCSTPGRTPSGTRIWSERRIGLTGALCFHVGLLVILLAGALRALCATSAVVDLVEGETLAPAAAAWSAQFPAVLGRPFHLAQPVSLVAVHSRLYADRDLQQLSLRLAHAGGESELAINRELRLAGGRIFLGHDFGPAALLEWSQPGRAPVRQTARLTHKGWDYGIAADGPGGYRAYLRAEAMPDGGRPQLLEIRVMRASGLIAAGELHVGEAIALPDGTQLGLVATPYWVRLQGADDPSLVPAGLGLLLVLLGVTLMFACVKVDTCVVVTPLGDREKVLVALRPQRFAPLFAERFAGLLREQGAPA